MVRSRRGTVEIESVEQFDDLIARGVTQARGWRVQDVGLRRRTSALLSLEPAGSLWLGCPMEPAAEQHLRDSGGLVFPEIPKLPFNPYRSRLYSPDELYDGLTSRTYEETRDARIHVWSRREQSDVERVVAAALHDESIEDALDDHVAGLDVVGVMGGHAVERGQPAYLAATRLGAALAGSGYLVASGGGPGAMEAANLGAYLHRADADVIDDAVAMLSKVPDFEPAVTPWAQAGFDVRLAFPDGADSLGIPTWYYGHEPPNVFANSIAKYFQNSVREDTLLRHCRSGVIFMPGLGGTVQEVFQSACDNYYARAATAVIPMVLVGTVYWTTDLPVWPLLQRLLGSRTAGEHVHLVDEADEVVDILNRSRTPHPRPAVVSNAAADE